MSSLIPRGGLFDDFFKDIAPGFYVRPLHGDGCRRRPRSRWM
jgi:HSP20 family protein